MKKAVVVVRARPVHVNRVLAKGDKFLILAVL